jgi:hypothetical protein
MKRVVIEELLPDMVLVKPVTNANGLPIVAVGTMLDALMIERLQRLGACPTLTPEPLVRSL